MVAILLTMLTTRPATAADAGLITHHRRRMFIDAGRADNQVLGVMARHFEPWVAKMIDAGKYFGWLTSDRSPHQNDDQSADRPANRPAEEDRVIAGAGLMLLDWAPHPLDPRSTQRGYLLNVYVEPEYRRRKLASHLIDLALAEARRRRIRVVALHSTAAGRRLYESNGFRATDEMFYVEPVEP
jgi:ribosomal protein S18 acetylase RimI-like enzyme